MLNIYCNSYPIQNCGRTHQKCKKCFALKYKKAFYKKTLYHLPAKNNDDLDDDEN